MKKAMKCLLYCCQQNLGNSIDGRLECYKTNTIHCKMPLSVKQVFLYDIIED